MRDPLGVGAAGRAALVAALLAGAGCSEPSPRTGAEERGVSDARPERARPEDLELLDRFEAGLRSWSADSAVEPAPRQPASAPGTAARLLELRRPDGVELAFEVVALPGSPAARAALEARAAPLGPPAAEPRLGELARRWDGVLLAVSGRLLVEVRGADMDVAETYVGHAFAVAAPPPRGGR